jgi:hypothetical protein
MSVLFHTYTCKLGVGIRSFRVGPFGVGKIRILENLGPNFLKKKQEQNPNRAIISN